MEKISILIPVYNTRRYVGRCIESVLKQDYPNMEVIVVNDGSTDNSLDILNEIQKKHPDVVKVISKQNAGVDLARKTALDNCSGDLLMFVDSDDTIEPGCLRLMYETMKREDVDVVEARSQNLLFGGLKRSKPLSDSQRSFFNRKLTHEELMKDFYISFFGVNILSVNLWGKLYKKYLFDNIATTGLRFGEDLAMSMRIFPKIKSMYLIDDVIYNYRVGGVTSHYMPKLLPDVKELYYVKKQALKENNFEAGYRTIIFELKNCLKSEITQVLVYKKKSNAQWLIEELKESIYDDFTNLLATDYVPKSNLDMAIYQRDGEKVWKMMSDNYNPWQLKNIVKYLISKLT